MTFHDLKPVSAYKRSDISPQIKDKALAFCSYVDRTLVINNNRGWIDTQ